MITYLDDNNVAERLIAEYWEYKNLVIALDFDDTIFDLHELDLNVQPVLDLIYRCQDLGFTICLWTAVTDKWQLRYKKSICNTLGIKPQYYNESPIMNDSRKPHFSILLDDRAGLKSAYNALSIAVNEIESTTELKHK